MEENDKELEDLFSEEPAEQAPGEPTAPEEPSVVEEEEESPAEEVEEEEEVEVEALTEREKALISQFTETDNLAEQDFDPSVPPSHNWQNQEYKFILEDESIDDILADPAKFNAKMAQLYNDALKKGAELALEATYRGLPRTISTYAKQQIETTNLVNDFYQQNKDLIPLKPALARIAQKVGTEHPEYTLPQLLFESAKAARAIFKLRVRADQQAPAKPKSSPAFVGQKGGANRIVRPKGSKSLEDEVMDLIT